MKTYSVIWSKEARTDFEALIDYLILHDPSAVESVFEEILTAADSLERFPDRGRKVPELLEIPHINIREILYKPWRLIYKVAHTEVRILMLIDGRRVVADELLRKLLS